MKLIHTIFLLTLMLFSNASNAATDQKPPTYNWSNLISSFENYSNYPTPENANKVISLLPKERINYTGTSEEKEMLEFIYSRNQFGMLERQVISGEKEAIRLAYGLKSIADGAFSEDLSILLGKLIRINPKLFLQGLIEFQNLVVRYDALVGNHGDIYVDRHKAQCYEDQLRIESLLAVDEPNLIMLRDKCIAILRSSILNYCNGV